MGLSLLYHGEESGETSPFDKAILRVSKNSAISIACPYIQLPYLNRIISVSVGWRLLSDVEAWMTSVSSAQRWDTYNFIRDNIGRIRHVQGLHAKAIISSKAAYVGSANLTSSGIRRKTELGLLIDATDQVAELNEWFETLWRSSASP